MLFALTNRQRKYPFDLSFLRRLLPLALPLCLETRGPADAPLAEIPLIQATILSDAAIARIHGEYLQDATPTDVITFPYGEILLGAGIITTNAQIHGHSPDREAVLCFIHSLLHLNGFDDLEENNRKNMHHRQEQILQKIAPQ